MVQQPAQRGNGQHAYRHRRHPPALRRRRRPEEQARHGYELLRPRGPARYLSYDDETSILAKGAFSKSKGYGGIIVWTIQEGWLPPNASGGRAQNALMQALKKGFIDIDP